MPVHQPGPREATGLSGLLTPAGQAALEEAGRLAVPAAGFLPLYQRLARRYPDGLARAAAEQALLRLRAADKFSQAQRMYFSREALEQATSEPVAQQRARRFRDSERVFDLGCGLGGDALALAGYAPVVGVDHRLARLRLLTANAEALGLSDRIAPLCADLRRLPWCFPKASAALFDPSRRAGGRRLSRTDRYQPPLSVIDAWLPGLRALAVKLSPALDLAEVARYDCEVEFVALGNELKEAVLWFGDLRGPARRATILPGPHTLTAAQEPDLEVGPPLGFLYEPNPAVMRAGLVRTLGEMLSARLLDSTTAFLSADTLVATPFARSFQIRESLPFHLKTLRQRLRQQGVGHVTVKKRGSAVTPEVLERRLRLRGDNEATVVLTRVVGRPTILLVEPVAASGATPAA